MSTPINSATAQPALVGAAHERINEEGCWLGRCIKWIFCDLLGSIWTCITRIFCCPSSEQQPPLPPPETPSKVESVSVQHILPEASPETSVVEEEFVDEDLFSEIDQEESSILLPPCEVKKGALPIINPRRPTAQSGLNELLLFLASSSEYDSLLVTPLPDVQAAISAKDTPAQGEAKIKTAGQRTLQRNELQQELLLIVNHLRSGEKVTVGTLKQIQTLLIRNGCRLRTLQVALRSLHTIFETSRTFKDSPKKAASLEDIKENVLSAPSELVPASDYVISRPLRNVGATCYMNSVLQLIARLNCFNEMLTHPICFSPPFQYPGESTDDYDLRCVSARREFDATLEVKNALQGHLCAIIQQLRAPNTLDPIGARELSTLFKLLQLCGWRYTQNEQADPQELIAFIRMKLGDHMPFIQQKERFTYVMDGVSNTLWREGEELKEINLPLPLDTEGKLLPEYDTVDKLIECYSHENIAADPENLNGFRPSSESPFCDAVKDVFFVGDAPTTLFIQQKRFSFDAASMAASRIGAATPFSPTIQVPFYDSRDLSAPPVLRQYRLKVAIAHAGNQSNSGHYTTIAWQKYKAAADQNYEDTWVLYNDSQLNRYHPDLEKANSVVNHLTSRAYYLAYELIPLD